MWAYTQRELRVTTSSPERPFGLSITELRFVLGSTTVTTACCLANCLGSTDPPLRSWNRAYHDIGQFCVLTPYDPLTRRYLFGVTGMGLLATSGPGLAQILITDVTERRKVTMDIK
jgi:hypothetical protein